MSLYRTTTKSTEALKIIRKGRTYILTDRHVTGIRVRAYARRCNIAAQWRYSKSLRRADATVRFMHH
eukprot:77608-Pleurochrysis_carterae.AAC.1